MNDNQFENEDLKDKDDSDGHEKEENKKEEPKQENQQEQDSQDKDKKSSDEDKKQDDKYNPFNNKNKRDEERRRVVGKAIKVNFNFKGLLMLIFIITLAVVVPNIMDENKNQQVVDVSYSDFIKNIENKKIAVVEEKDGYVYGYKASEVK